MSSSPGLVAATAELKMGNGLDEGVQQGPLVNVEQAVERCRPAWCSVSTEAGCARCAGWRALGSGALLLPAHRINGGDS